MSYQNLDNMASDRLRQATYETDPVRRDQLMNEYYALLRKSNEERSKSANVLNYYLGSSSYGIYGASSQSSPSGICGTFSGAGIGCCATAVWK
jgi:hypothetical protein